MKNKIPVYLTNFVFVWFLCIVDIGRCDEVKTVEIECREIRNEKWKSMNREHWTCRNNYSSLVANDPNVEIDEILFPNRSQVENLDKFGALYIKNAKMKFMPNGIKRIFPNLEAIIITYCELTYLDKENMKQFGRDLQLADFKGNLITVLDDDLFEFNHNLKLINFYACPLKFIDPGFFERLQHFDQIENVWMRNCKCIDQKFELSLSSEGIANFEWNNENCTDIVKLLEDYLKLPIETKIMKNVDLNRLEKVKKGLYNEINKPLMDCKELIKNQTSHGNSKEVQISDGFYVFTCILICYLMVMIQ